MGKTKSGTQRKGDDIKNKKDFEEVCDRLAAVSV